MSSVCQTYSWDIGDGAWICRAVTWTQPQDQLCEGTVFQGCALVSWCQRCSWQTQDQSNSFIFPRHVHRHRRHCRRRRRYNVLTYLSVVWFISQYLLEQPHVSVQLGKQSSVLFASRNLSAVIYWNYKWQCDPVTLAPDGHRFGHHSRGKYVTSGGGQSDIITL